jgi:NTE family protein
MAKSIQDYNKQVCAIEFHDNPVNRRIVLVLQGGGALGAFQAGVYEALEEYKFIPNWIGGTSIGAINASIIAGNKPQHRLAKLKKFWETVAQPDIFKLTPDISNYMRQLYSYWQVQKIMLSGIPVFFKPIHMSSMLDFMHGKLESYYDTSPLRELLLELVDFNYLNSKEVRLSLGATNIKTGQMRYFDSKYEEIRPEHIMASGALPPAFPPVKIDDAYYWDGGVYSNTPLTVVLDDSPRVDSLCFMVDLWRPCQQIPSTMDEISKLQKDIIYSSRSDEHRKTYEVIHNLRRAIRALYDQLPDEKQKLKDNIALAALGCVTSMDIVHLQYQPFPWELSSKDADFSASTIKERWYQGYLQAAKMCQSHSLCEPHPPNIGVVIHEAKDRAA